MKKLRHPIYLLAAAVAYCATISCGADFRPKNAVEGVRILAAKADLPYAHPGESVHIEALVHDGRKLAPGAEPMHLYWFPVPCIDPPLGQYYGCYPGFEAFYPIGVDLTPQLRDANDTTITIPADALAKASKRPGQLGDPVATAYVFMVACAGHVERIPRRGGLAPNAVPLGCFNSRHEQLGENDFVLGFTRVFIFATRRNVIPTLDGVTFEGSLVDPAKGITTGKCVKNKQGDCNTVKLDTLFQDSTSETDPDNINVDGVVAREAIYVDWFTSIGKFSTDRKILFDAYLGRPPKTEIEFTPPEEPSKGKVWAVLHDNRGGTTWLEIPIDIQ
jgi:hypothetical protein